MNAANRPWWRKKRWRAVALLCLGLPTYIAATGPVMYAETCGWLPTDTYVVTFRPLYRTLFAVQGGDGPASRVLIAYSLWWSNLTPAVRGVRITDPYP